MPTWFREKFLLPGENINMISAWRLKRAQPQLYNIFHQKETKKDTDVVSVLTNFQEKVKSVNNRFSSMFV